MRDIRKRGWFWVENELIGVYPKYRTNKLKISFLFVKILECPPKFRLFLSNFFLSFLYGFLRLINPILLCILLLLYHISIYSYIPLLKLSRFSKFSLCTYSFFNVAWNDPIQALS